MILIFGFLFFIFFLVVTGLLAAGTGFYTHINLMSFLLILIPLFFFLFITRTGNNIGRYFSASFKKNYTYTKTELEGISSAIKNSIKFTIAAGIANFVFFIIIMLTFIGDPQQLGPNLAICLTSLTYAILLSYFVLFPVQAWAENKINILLNSEPEETSRSI